MINILRSTYTPQEMMSFTWHKQNTSQTIQICIMYTWYARM